MTLVAAPGMSLLAGWVPALIAAREDPADILRGDNRCKQKISGSIIAISPQGPVDFVSVEVDSRLTLTAYVHSTSCELETGTRVHLSFPASSIHVFPERR